MSGYENSLMRWLLYLNPAARFGEFLAGLAAAHLYLVQHPRLSPLSTKNKVMPKPTSVEAVTDSGAPPSNAM